MTLDLASIPLAFLAGAVGVLSPCVWPLVPVVMSTAAQEGGPGGPFRVVAGLGLSFALAGTLLSFALVRSGLDPELLRPFAAGMLLLAAATLLVESWGSRVSAGLSRVVGGLGPGSGTASGPLGQLAVGALLGLVWLPCVGPTLGAAIGLASLGQDLFLAFLTMLAYGLGTGLVLLGAAWTSRELLARWRPALTAGGASGKRLLGALLGILALLVLTGMDKRVETWAVPFVPEWVFSF